MRKKIGHGWMMIACCLPLIMLAAALAATGVVGVGAVLGAVMCIAMMGVMMAAVSRGSGRQGGG